jgi:hypothetical protein
MGERTQKITQSQRRGEKKLNKKLQTLKQT